MDELLEAQVFKEASPEVVRYRLGIWEGPLADEASGGLSFLRQWPGRDAAAVQITERGDDPRLEAAANISFRLTGWMHLWRGFLGEDGAIGTGRNHEILWKREEETPVFFEMLIENTFEII